MLLKSAGGGSRGVYARICLRVGIFLRCLSTAGAAGGRSRLGVGGGLVSTRVVYLKASDVAACIGRNQYKPPAEVLADMHKRYSAETFSGQTKLDAALKAVERLPALEKSMLLEAAAMPLVQAADVKQVLGKVKETIDQSRSISEQDKNAVVSLLTGTMQTNLGTRTEDLIVQKVEAEQRVKMDRSLDMYSVPLCRLGDTQYTVRGRIDRLQQIGGDPPETILVEIKARVNKLFRTLRDYEMIQVQTYLQMLPPELGVRRARLIEQFEGQNHSHDLVRDDTLWQGEILPGLVDFCKELDNAMKGGPVTGNSNSNSGSVFTRK